jgi:hypothetical protein
LAAGLPGRRIGRHRRAHAGVSLRAQDWPRAAGDHWQRDRHAVAVGNDYEIWNAFGHHHWPTLYFIDADGMIRDHHLGEGRYEQPERVTQRVLGLERELVSVEGRGVLIGVLGFPP